MRHNLPCPRVIQTATAVPEPPPKLIKKYANRRLYDTEDSKYITLSDLMEMTRERIDYRVVDARGGHDITRQVLVQIIIEQEADEQTAMMSVPVLREMVSLYGNSPINRLFINYLGEVMTNFLRHQTELKEQTLRVFEGISPAPVSREMSEQQVRMWKAMMTAFNWSPNDPNTIRVPFADIYDGAARENLSATDPSQSTDPSQLSELRRQIEDLQRRVAQPAESTESS